MKSEQTMRHRLFFLLLLSVVGTPVFAQQTLPKDVTRFVDQRDGCDHFRGEEPYDEARRKFLDKSMDRLCTGTDKKLARLKKKYAGRPDVMSKLNEYEIRIEGR
jgi:hypothetical protein